MGSRTTGRRGVIAIAVVTLLATLLPAAVVVALLAEDWVWPRGGDTARFGAAHPAGGLLTMQVTAGALVPARDWPSACGLLTDAEIRAVLPDARRITRMYDGVMTRTIEEFAADPSWHAEAYAAQGRCVWGMELPGEAANSWTWIRVRIDAVGDPDLVRRYHASQELGRGAGLGAIHPPGVDACYVSALYDAHLVCRQGPLMFDVGGSTTATFGGQRGYAFWRDAVLPAFATTIAAHVPAG